MAEFKGFREGKIRLVPVPGPFFQELLPLIDHLGELKVTLFAFWRLDQMEGAFRYLRRSDFAGDSGLMQGLGASPEEAQPALDDALGRAVRRGSFVCADLEQEHGKETLYFVNTPKGRAAVQAIRRGEFRYTGEAQAPVEWLSSAPNIFRLYEEHIGPLTPMISEALRDAEETYPANWIEEAVRIAVESNKRNWRYVAAILNRWQQEGRDERQDRRDSEKDRRRYVEGEFSDFIEH